jgi:hypothetical protein
LLRLKRKWLLQCLGVLGALFPVQQPSELIALEEEGDLHDVLLHPIVTWLLPLLDNKKGIMDSLIEESR